jgi:hypothetical protein
MSTGWDFDDELKKFKEESQSRNKRPPFGLNVPKGGESSFIILREDLFTRYEHEFVNPNKFKELGTPHIECLDTGEDDSDCPMCREALISPNGFIKARTYVGYITVMELGEFRTKSSDKVYKNPIRAARMKSKTLEQLKKIHKRQKGVLFGLEINASRGTDNFTPQVGDHWLPGDYHKEEELTKLNPDWKKLIHVWAEALPRYNAKEIRTQIELFGGGTFTPAPKQTDEEYAGATGW